MERVVMNILLALEDKEISRILAFALEGRLNVKCIECATTLEAAKMIEGAEIGIDILIAEGTDKPGSVLQYAIARRVRVPVILLVLNDAKKSGSFGLKNRLGVVTSEQQDKLLEQVVALIVKHHKERLEKDPRLAATALPLLKRSLSKTQETADTKTAGATNEPLLEKDFSRINTNLLLRVSPLKSGIYIKLGAQKYLKIFQEGDVFDRNDLEKYLEKKKIDYFYLLNSEVGEFMGRLQQDLLEILKMKKGPQLAKVGAEVNEAVHETVKELISNLGVTPEVQTLVKSSMDLAVKNMSRSPRLSMVIERMKREPNRYISSHSMMLGEIACGIAHAAGWHSDATVYKLNLAAFLHDVTLKNHSLASIQTLEELALRRSEFTDKEVAEYKDHPTAAAEIARQFTEVPPDVDVIVAQHHERPDGSGFPRGLTNANISPLGAAFLVAHDLLIYMMKVGDGWTMEGFLQENEAKYVGGNFKKIMKVMQKLQEHLH